MFGMGGTEILVILIVALLFLGPDKLPEAAKSISKGIRDIKKQSRVLQRTIEDDEHIGGAIRDLKSALRGEDEPIRPPKPRKQLVEPADAAAIDAEAALTATATAIATAEPHTALPAGETASVTEAPDAFEGASDPPRLTMPPTAGEPDEAVPASTASADAELAALVKPAPNTIAHAPPAPRPVGEPSDTSGPKHG